MTTTADHSLQKMLLFSAIGHVLILFFFTVTTYIIGPAEITLPQAIRVDVVGLPEKIEKPELHPKPKAESKPEPAKPKLPPKEAAELAKPKAPVLPGPKAKATDKSKAQREALNKIKAASAMDRIREQLEKERAEKQAAATKSATIKGNKVSEGNSLTGLDAIEFDKYLAELQARLNANFEIPQWLADADLSAVVVITIDERGYVTRKTMTKSSGNTVFDTIVMGTIEKSSPMPPPPDRLRGRLATSGIPVKFPM